MNRLQAPLWSISLGRRTQASLWLAMLAAADLCLLLPVALPLKAAGGFLLLGLLPGLALVSAWFAREGELGWAERIAFSIGLSVGLSLQATWGYSIVAGRMSLPGLVAVLNLLTLVAGGIALYRLRANPNRAPMLITLTLGGLISFGLILLVALTCFFWLDYSDYDLDEVPVLDSASAMILGDRTAVFRLAKGPAQVILSAAFILFGDSQTEGYLRAPFAMLTVAAALAFLGIAKRVLGQPAAWLALLCLALDGFSISKGRVVQFQTLVYPFVFLAFAAFVVGTRSAAGDARRRFQLAGAFFGGTGLFAHYTGAFILPTLALLWLWSERGRLRQRATWFFAALLAAIGGVSGVLYYILMLRQPALAGKVGSYYVGFRIGNGPFDMLDHIAANIRLYEAPPWILFVVPGLLLLAAVVGWQLLSTRRRLGILYCAAGGAIALRVVAPDLFDVAGVNLIFVPFLLLAACVALGVTLRIEIRALGIWLLGALFAPAFWMQVPGNHFNLILPPAIVLATLGWRELVPAIGPRVSGRARTVVSVAGAAAGLGLSVWALLYVYLLFIAHSPEYAVLYPAAAPQPLALFAGASPDVKYNIPHNNGWRVIAALYDAGELRGEFRTNEFAVAPDWYLLRTWKPDRPQPRYYFFVPNQQVPALGSAPPDDLTQHYWLWGRITVAGEPHMLIYQLRDDQPPGATRTLAVESYAAAWQDLASLARLEAFRDFHRDDTAFYALAHFLESNGRDADALAFDDTLGRGLLSKFYRGNLPYLASAQASEIAPLRRVWGIYWASADRSVERDVAENACPAVSQWFGNVRLVLNGVAVFAAPVSLNARLGDGARLESFALPEQAARAGGILCVRLDWNASAPTAKPLKLFLHLLDSQGKLVAQADTEPQAGFSPTTQWQAGERIEDRVGLNLPAQLQPGRYRLVGGLYDADTGARQPALATDGSRYPDDSVDFGSVAIQ